MSYTSNLKAYLELYFPHQRRFLDFLRSEDTRDCTMSQEELNSPEVMVTDRRRSGDRRQNKDRRQKSIPVAVERRSGTDRREQGERRRQIDPTTCERDYSDDEISFMKAMDDYKRANRRPFPTWSEVLEVLYALGYRKVEEPTPLPGMAPNKE